MMITVYVTFPSANEAKKTARHLLNQKLIACANIFPVQSLHVWKGRINDQKEAVMLCKTKKGNFKRIESEIKKLHSYDVPCIVAFAWEAASKDYSEWVNKNV